MPHQPEAQRVGVPRVGQREARDAAGRVHLPYVTHTRYGAKAWWAKGSGLNWRGASKPPSRGSVVLYKDPIVGMLLTISCSNKFEIVRVSIYSWLS